MVWAGKDQAGRPADDGAGVAAAVSVHPRVGVACADWDSADDGRISAVHGQFLTDREERYGDADGMCAAAAVSGGADQADDRKEKAGITQRQTGMRICRSALC